MCTRFGNSTLVDPLGTATAANDILFGFLHTFFTRARFQLCGRYDEDYREFTLNHESDEKTEVGAHPGTDHCYYTGGAYVALRLERDYGSPACC